MLRKLLEKDAPFMYEWMQDDKVLMGLSSKFETMTLQDCEKFIFVSQNDEANIHKAIVNENDEYLGTVSLKHVNQKYHSAEFAIVLRTKAIRRGYGKNAMNEIIDLGFHEYMLENIYWQVLKANEHAIGFYDHLGYNRTDNVPYSITDAYGGLHPEKYYWYYAKRMEKQI